MTEIAVCISSYGESQWEELALARAMPSTEAAGATTVECCHLPTGTLAEARNQAASQTTAAWLCFLDADDELEAGFIPAMQQAISRHGQDDCLYVPAVRYIMGRNFHRPMFNKEVPYQDGNWLVIGTVISHAAFDDVGGFEEWDMYEDWALFARIQKLGHIPIKVPAAVYRAHRSPRSRNHPAGGAVVKLAAHNAIRRAVFPELYA